MSSLPEPDKLQEAFEQWVQRVVVAHDFVCYPNEQIHWTPPQKPLREARVALICSGGLYHCSQPAFDVTEPGDASYRLIQADVATQELRFAHSHFDHSDADEDANCLFPLDRLRELAEEGEIGAVAPVHVGFKGDLPDAAVFLKQSVPDICRLMQETGVDVVVLSPG